VAILWIHRGMITSLQSDCRLACRADARAPASGAILWHDLFRFKCPGAYSDDFFLRSSKTFHQSRELTPFAQTVDFESH
jgi:hypothetical protein